MKRPPRARNCSRGTAVLFTAPLRALPGMECRVRPDPYRLGARALVGLFLLTLASGPGQPLAAQMPEFLPSPGLDGDLVDRVVAIVGDSAVFLSQVQEQVLRLRASGMPMPEDPEDQRELEREVLDEIVNQMLILNAAAQDTLLTVPDGRLDQETEQAWQDAVQRFGSEATMLRALESEGLTIAEYRGELREEIRKGLLSERFVQTELSEARIIPVEETEMRAFFERERDALGNRPATITFDQVLLAPEPSDSVKAEASQRASELLSLLEEGEDFGDLARRFSDDPGSAQRGGELGWIRRGMMVQEFEDAAFGLFREEISDVVDSQFGSHILQVQRVRGPERMVRHILIATQPTSADIDAARRRAQEIRAEVEGGAPLSDFYEEGEDIGIPQPMTLTRDRLGQLPSGLAQALDRAQAGDVLGPIEVQGQPGQPAYSVVRVEEIREAGTLTYEDVRDQIRGVLQDEQLQQELLNRLRTQIYVDVRW